MKKKCINAETNIFVCSIEPRFSSFKDKIKKLSKKHNIVFDEDIFMDTILKCIDTFPTQEAKDADVDNYFWVAFKQNSISATTRDKFRNMIDIDDADDIIDEIYNEDIDVIADVIKNEIICEYGDEIYNAWLLHICDGYTYKELSECGYGHLNLHNEFKKIKRYICNKVVKKNKCLQSMLDENGFYV